MNRAAGRRRALRWCRGRGSRLRRASRTSRSRGPYDKNFAVWRFNQAKVISLLKEQGLHRWSRQAERGQRRDFFSCPNVGKLSFRFHTTTGNQLRALTFEIIQRQLKSVGIELVPRFQTGGVMFGTTLPSRGLGPDAVRMGRLAVLLDHAEGHLRLRWRPERRRLLQPGPHEGPEPGLGDA